MCNPRRVTVTATRDIAEAWRREASRTVELSSEVVGEARLRQPLASRLGTPALRALEARLAAGAAGWTATPEGYRHDVDGGYVLYRTDEQALEIVATLAAMVTAAGTARTLLEGELRDTLSASAERRYFDDAYVEQNEARARADAERELNQTLQQALREKLAQAQHQAEAAQADRLQTEAEAAAHEALRQTAAERRATLARLAEEHLETVGLRCRQAFNQLLALAYRDAILAYARRHGADAIQCRDDEGVLEIEFFMEG